MLTTLKQQNIPAPTPGLHRANIPVIRHYHPPPASSPRNHLERICVYHTVRWRQVRGAVKLWSHKLLHHRPMVYPSVRRRSQEDNDLPSRQRRLDY